MEETEMIPAKNFTSGVSRFIKDNGPKFIDDLTSDMVHIESVNCSINRKHISSLEERGHKIRRGPWSKEETALLKKNFDTYVKNNNIDDPLRLLNSKSDIKIREMIKKTSFQSAVCRNLNRSSYAVYMNLKYRLLYKGKSGVYTHKEDKQLKNFVRIHGKNFVKIALSMNRSIFSVCRRYLLIEKENCCKGPWSKKEEHRLLCGLKTVMRTNDIESLHHGFDIKWKEISQYVKTRNFQQCYVHFKFNKKFRLESSLSRSQPWTKQHTVLLINNLYDINCDDENDIDWIELNQLFTDVSPSASYLQTKFRQLKSRIEDFNRKSFEDNVEALRVKYCNS